MQSQMYVDLIAQELVKQSIKEGEVNPFRFPVIGTLSGSSVIIDAIPEPVPLKEFQFLIDEHTATRPNYANGDRLVIIPISDGGHWVIAGRLI